ncbi:hypothetical protein ACFPYJ_03540 [Paenibacillus solisilvae]|uniref:Uncharacterized protein n=1 Tax=Paenibacillus solisilvae TaxID=2486751 RepID=A0ABW0VQY2_9BACL
MTSRRHFGKSSHRYYKQLYTKGRSSFRLPCQAGSDLFIVMYDAVIDDLT